MRLIIGLLLVCTSSLAFAREEVGGAPILDVENEAPTGLNMQDSGARIVLDVCPSTRAVQAFGKAYWQVCDTAMELCVMAATAIAFYDQESCEQVLAIQEREGKPVVMFFDELAVDE